MFVNTPLTETRPAGLPRDPRDGAAFLDWVTGGAERAREQALTEQTCRASRARAQRLMEERRRREAARVPAAGDSAGFLRFITGR